MMNQLLVELFKWSLQVPVVSQTNMAHAREQIAVLSFLREQIEAAPPMMQLQMAPHLQQVNANLQAYKRQLAHFVAIVPKEKAVVRNTLSSMRKLLASLLIVVDTQSSAEALQEALGSIGDACFQATRSLNLADIGKDPDRILRGSIRALAEDAARLLLAHYPEQLQPRHLLELLRVVSQQ